MLLYGYTKQIQEVTPMTLDALKNIIEAQLDIDPSTINENTSITEDLGADSLDMVELMMTVEEEFDITIKDSIIDYINQNNIVFQSNSLKLKVIEDFMIGLSGYGILQPLMDDDEIEEIYVYAPDKIWYLKEGKNILSSIRLTSLSTSSALSHSPTARYSSPPKRATM